MSSPDSPQQIIAQFNAQRISAILMQVTELKVRVFMMDQEGLFSAPELRQALHYQFSFLTKLFETEAS